KGGKQEAGQEIDAMAELTIMKVAEMFENSREFYIQQDWNPAIEGFQECLNLLPEDAALEMHLDRARSFALSNPPENWDGVHQYFEK
ncbi:MAG: hypothetical protein VXC58_09725, partial [Deltaproteobacteria bacterium]